MREASLGEMGMWVTEHVQQTHNQEDILTTDDVWEAAQEAAPGNSEETVWGRTRRQLVDFLKLLLKVQSTRGRVKGKILHYWRGYRLLSDGEIERMEHEEEQQVPGPLVYCRTCKTMILGVRARPPRRTAMSRRRLPASSAASCAGSRCRTTTPS